MDSAVLSGITVASTVGLAALVAGGAWSAARRAGVARKWPAGITTGVAAWATLALTLASRGFYATTPDTKVPFIGLGIVLPVVAGTLIYRSSATIRTLVSAVPPHLLVGAQAYRVLGVLFLISWAAGELPGEFALPAGLGDVAVGLAAPVVAYGLYKQQHGAGQVATVWNLLGIADLVVAVACGFLTAPSIFQQLALGSPNLAISRFPLVLIPTFLVPISVLLHFGLYSSAVLRRPLVRTRGLARSHHVT